MEKTQLVRTTAVFPGLGQVVFYGVVEEVARRSRRRDVLEERDRYDGAPGAELLLDSAGVTYARTRLLASEPPLMTPPREESPVRLATREDARKAYGIDEMGEPLSIGLLKNGATGDAGEAAIDLAYLLGQNGAHANVTGVSGAATKSSALTTLLACLLHHARSRPRRHTEPLHIVLVILNVKGTDLLFLDRGSRVFQRRAGEEVALWQRLGVDPPRPFAGAEFYAPQQLGTMAPVALGRETRPYSWKT